MPSEALKAFDANVEDVDRLLALHSTAGGSGQGRRYGLEVLNKSAIVLVTAYWEAYCEDIAAEALAHIIKNTKSSSHLPEELKKQMAKELKAAPQELEVWKIADRGWKKYLSDRLEQSKEKRNRELNTPKTAQIDELFLKALGIKAISASWKWKRMSANQAGVKLDKYVTLRGSIAHRGKGSTSIKKSHVQDYFNFIETLAAKTGGAVNAHVKRITGQSLWA